MWRTWKRLDWFSIINAALLALFSLLVIYPFYYAFMNSLNAHLYESLSFIWNRGWTFSAYSALLQNKTMITALRNSILRTVAGSIVSLAVCTMAGYAMSKPYLYGRKAYLIILAIPMFFSGGKIPIYLNISNLRLLNSFLVYLLPRAFSFFWMTILMAYFRKTPSELEDAAYIDGATTWQVFLYVVIPISYPALATVALYAAVSQWNAWYDTAYYTTDRSLTTLSWLLLRMTKDQSLSGSLGSSEVIRNSSYNPESIKMAAMILASIPVLVVYPFLQKYFVKGVTIGSLKG